MRRLSPLGFYSKAAEKAQELPEGSFPAQQLISTLINKGGGKEELIHAGLLDESEKPHPDWVKRGKITKQDLVEHLHKSMPQISEVVRHRDPSREIDELSKSTQALEDRMGFYSEGSPERQEREQILQERKARLAQLQHIKENMIPDKFGDLTLPYQKHYREILLQHQAPRQWQNGNPVTEEDLATEQGRADADRAAAFVNTPFTSSHWDTPNVLAHVRLSDRLGPRGEKVLHIEELQSDWGQKARKQGTVKANEKKIIQLNAERDSHPAGSPEREEVQKRLDDFIDKKFPGAPEGPYIGNTSSWTDLLLKRVLHEAAKGGYDQVVWTPGQQHINRYGLRNYVDRIAYDPEEKELSYVPKEGNYGWVNHREPLEPHELGKVIGEDAAKQLLETPPSPLSGNHVLETKDFAFGGEGMKSYYDSIVPKRLQKLARDHDPQAKVGPSTVKLPPDTERGDPDEPIKPLGLTITPQMRQSILQGQPAFRDGGAVDDEDDGITAYHASPKQLSDFKPSGFRGSTFFASTPKRAIEGAGAGANEMVMDTATELKRGPMFIHKVNIDPSKIAGLHYTPAEKEWFHSMPSRIVGDDALEEAMADRPNPYISWDDIYDHHKVGDRLYEYRKRKEPPSVSYEQAYKTGKDVYGRQHSHYAPEGDEKKNAQRTLASGMKGHLVHDEAGLSIAMADPSHAKIKDVKHFANGGALDDEDEGITAYHGSPHDFDQFDVSKIGTGEGAQTFGHGLYFAGNEDVAKGYRDKLSGSHKNITIDGTPFPEYMRKPELLTDPEHDIKASIAANMAIGLNGEPKSQDEAIVALRKAIKQSIRENPKDADRHRQRLQLLDKMAQGPLDIQAPQGRMYEVHINAHPDHMLDWDKPLNDQHPHILQSLFAARKENPSLWSRIQPHIESDSTAGDVYQKIAAGHPQGYAGASEWLSRAGIKGIKYLDGSSRSAGEGSRNFVVFDHNHVKVRRKYEQGGAVG